MVKSGVNYFGEVVMIPGTIVRLKVNGTWLTSCGKAALISSQDSSLSPSRAKVMEQNAPGKHFGIAPKRGETGI